MWLMHSLEQGPTRAMHQPPTSTADFHSVSQRTGMTTIFVLGMLGSYSRAYNQDDQAFVNTYRDTTLILGTLQRGIKGRNICFKRYMVKCMLIPRQTLFRVERAEK